MAIASNITTTNAGAFDRIQAAFRALSERVAQYKVYRATINELQELSNRELADLGISRSMIKRLAYEAAYEH
ncbi:hypothetical protein PSA7680_01148 [Pseudoruegeria aquimaris]|uniref:YjiS-like domain-containing protein n=1 Tax=Pseudoruegeria aquimaris TaxID=393663 RepID=A0A1Y5RXB6_9RHOB|nr:DUF1127 domain-containing protein [Pseudoruegeria aquimaris]SLN26308.1 hypothetical protein PSA7680_01148 [Pseudoruegeria aquimaris]